MAKYEELQQQLFTEFLRLCDVIDQCARILLQHSPEPVLPGIGGPAAQQTEEYVKKVSIDAAKKKDAVWDVYSLLGQLHGHVSPTAENHVNGVDGAIGKVGAAAQNPNETPNQIDLAVRMLDDWEGKAATAAMVKLTELKTFAQNQNEAIALLKGVLEQYGTMVHTGEDNAEQFATGLTGALADAAALEKTTRREFPVKLFEDALDLYEAKKDPIGLYKGVKKLAGDIHERQEVLEATQPDKIITESTPKVTALRENLAAAGDRLAKRLDETITALTQENGKVFFSDTKLHLDIRNPDFTAAEFRLRDADDWGEFAGKVDKLPKTLPGDGKPGPLTQRLEGAHP